MKKIADHSIVSNQLPINAPTGDVFTADQAADSNAICILGAVSGLSCGADHYQAASGLIVFEATSTHGDSGTQNNAAMPLDRTMPALGIGSANLSRLAALLGGTTQLHTPLTGAPGLSWK